VYAVLYLINSYVHGFLTVNVRAVGNKHEAQVSVVWLLVLLLEMARCALCMYQQHFVSFTGALSLDLVDRRSRCFTSHA
jgi:hypothetical protein